MSREEVDKAVDYLVENARLNPRDLSRDATKQALTKVEEGALEGLPANTISTLAYKVIFTNSYDQITRRRLMYCLVPEGQEFPLMVVPLAVSSAQVKGVSVSWQYAVLAWLQGLLEYGIISSAEPLVHICYTTVFNLASSLTLSSVACRMLYHITVREDVTPNRVAVLMRLKNKPAFHAPITYLLRLYHIFRPDMVAGKLMDRNIVIHSSPALKARLLQARTRLQGTLEDLGGMDGRDRVWRDGLRAEKANVYQRPTAVPQPQFNTYTTTVEEQKERVIYVTQYQRFHELLRGMDKWECWVWPTNPAAHLVYPLVVPLFRPHHQEVRVALTNWLEVALRTEVIEGIRSPGRERQASLLRVAYDLCLTQAASVPVVSNFLMELFTKWDHQDHFEKVIRLLEFLGFKTSLHANEVLMPLLSRLMSVPSLIIWCRVVEAVTAMICRWAFTAHHQKNDIVPDGSDWPDQEEEYQRAVEGMEYLTTEMEKRFLSGILEFNAHPLVIHHVLDYYAKVDLYCELLELPLMVFPPAIITITVLTSADLTTTHRLGLALSRTKERLQTLKRMWEDGCQDPMLQAILQKLPDINESVAFFLSGVLLGKAFSPRWKEHLDPFYSFDFLEEVIAKKDAEKFASITHAIPYLPFVCSSLMERGDSEEQTTDTSFETMQESVLADLRNLGLTGIEQCSETFKK